ncbi:MAG: hypothetical protein PHG07_08010 [Lachnospiraceae bacterium]|nr:hypothetical protein [Lachnospiraceae bacterium]
MKRKIIALYSYSITIASGASAIALPWITTEVLPCCLWVLAVLTAMAGLLWLYKNAPVERQLRQGHKGNYTTLFYQRKRRASNERIECR